MDTLKKLRIVIQAAQRHSAWVEKEIGVTGAQLWIMQELGDAAALRVGEIAERLAIHQTTASNLLNALEKRGYIVKNRSSADQRVVTLSLSAAGRKVLGQAPAPARGLLVEALQKLEKKQLTQLDRGLDSMLGAIELADASGGLQLLPFMVRRSKRR
jgi:DNA-binding MarR family transcriptional regulator